MVRRLKSPPEAVKDWTKPGSIDIKSFLRSLPVEWTAPKFEEVSLNCEINSYASAEL
jgi:coenzyme PQQ precursor peptide PqqA